LDYRVELEKMQEQYIHTEKEFIEVSHIIPIENNPKTFSPRLYNILLTTCGQIEGMMKLICKNLSITGTQNADFPKLYKKLNRQGTLRNQAVFFIKNYKTITPFKFRSTRDRKVPLWWRNYNKSKHSLPDGFMQGNLTNTINALSALYSLHYIGYLAGIETEIDLLNKKHWFTSGFADARDSVTRRIHGIEQYKAGYSDLFSMRSLYNRDGAPIR
jgi:hypothetical protein